MPSSTAKRVCWDTCIIIDALQKVPGPALDLLQKQIELGEMDQLRIVVCTVSIAEAHYVKTLDPAESDKRLTGFYDNTYIDPYTVDEVVATKARELRRNHKISVCDSMVVASALLSGSSMLITRDGDGKKNANPLLALDKLVGGEPPLRIVSPLGHLAEEKARLEKEEANSPLGGLIDFQQKGGAT